MVQSNSLRIDEENQAITCIATYVAQVTNHIKDKKESEALYVMPQIESLKSKIQPKEAVGQIEE